MKGRKENISVSFDIEMVVGLGDSRLTSISDCRNRKMKLDVFTEYWFCSLKSSKV